MPIFYTPLYGVEPYNARGVPLTDPVGGGADVTQQNLLITLFEVVENPPGVFTYNRIKSTTSSADGVLATSFFGPGVDKSLLSRNSCRFWLQASGDAPGTSRLFLALLNPPSELVQIALDPDNLAFPVAAAPPIDFSLNSTKQVFFTFMYWTVRFFRAFAAGVPVDPAVIPPDSVMVGSPVFIPLPPYKTDGADGAQPIPYGPFLSTQNIIDNANLIKNGAPFFIPVLFSGVADAQGAVNTVVDIAWSHSGASRS